MNTTNKLNTTITALLLSCVFFLPAASSQESLSDEYYSSNIEAESPSRKYYRNNLRDEWDDDDGSGPGGSGDGDNQGVGVPAGGAGLTVSLCILAYSLYTRKRNNRQ